MTPGKLSDIHGKLELQSKDPSIIALTRLDSIVLGLLGLFMLYWARQFLADVNCGSVFTIENAQRLKKSFLRASMSVVDFKTMQVSIGLFEMGIGECYG
jgi:hypothetical protein